MSLETKLKASIPMPKKVRIGSRVPDNNREWLKKHGIVAETATTFSKNSFKSGIRSPSFWRDSFFLAVSAAACAALPFLFFQITDSRSALEAQKGREQSLAAANFHLRQSTEQFSAINLFQQSEINRMGRQLHDLAVQFKQRISGFETSEAMSDALISAQQGEWDRMSYRYDVEVEDLRSQIREKDDAISSLEYSLQSLENGVVVSADPIGGSMTNALIAAVNKEFQFVVADSGEIKGVRPGQIVELYHQGMMVGYGEVEKVYPEFSGVKVFSQDILNVLEKGDSVFIKMSAAA